MPLINAFLWIFLLLVLLLGLQLVMSYQKAERTAFRRIIIASRNISINNSHDIVRRSRQTIVSGAVQGKPAGFMTVGGETAECPMKTVNYRLPSGLPVSASAHYQEKAAIADCQPCA